MHKFLYNSLLVSLGVPKLEQSQKNHTLSVFGRNAAARLKHLVGNRFFIGFLLLTLLTSAILFVGIGAKNALSPLGSHDFQWTPTRDLVAGVSPYSDFLRWNAEGNEHTPPHFLNQSPSYPASVYVLLSPFATFDWPTAKLAWLIINLSLVVFLLLGLQRLYPIKSNVVLALVALTFLCSTPLRASLGAGQLNFLSLAAFVWAYHFARLPGVLNSRIAGTLLALAWVKYSLTFPLTLLFICRGKWKPVIIASLIHAALTIAAAIQIGMWPHEFFFSSVEVVLMGDGTGFLNLVALSMTLNLPMVVALSAIATATTYVFWALPKINATDDLVLMTFLGLFSCAVFYHHGYDFIVLILCTWALARQQLNGPAAYSCGLLVALAWAGQWLTHEIAPFLGNAGVFAAQFADSMLVIVFYCALALVWSSLHFSPTRGKTPKVAALPF